MSSRRKKRRRKKRTSTLGSTIFIILLFSGLAVLVLLVAPPVGVTASIRSFLYQRLGWLSFAVPLFLVQSGLWILNLEGSKRGFRAVTGLFVTGYFLMGLLDLLGRRFDPSFHNVPGGTAAGGLVAFLEGSIGSVITYLALLTCFLASLVVFTGWDLAADFRSLLGKLSSVRIDLSGLRLPARKRRRKKVPPVEEPAKADASTSPWQKVPPFRIDEPEPVAETPGGTSSQPAKTASAGRPGEPDRATSRASSDEVYSLPPEDVLNAPPTGRRSGQSREQIRARAQVVVEKLEDFDVSCSVVSSHPGPVLTRYELKPGPGVKVNRILALADDLALALKAKQIRVLAPIPGKGAVGIEVPNPDPETVYLREVMGMISDQRLPIALGKRLEGDPFVVDICEMPHLLVAGATGSGKSVCLHTIIASVLMKKTPRQVRLAMIDPKMLELSVYEGIPHLWSPVILEAKKAEHLLAALIREMEERFSRLNRSGVRSIEDFNARIAPEFQDERMPYILVVIDELADLMVTSGNEVEGHIERLAHTARAVGVHLVVATQRPSVDVITGSIKANFPCRIAFNVQSKTDSRTILDMNGAEKLLGKGDMLYLPPSSPEPERVHGSFVSPEEAARLVEHWESQPSMPYEYEPPEDDTERTYQAGKIKLDDPLLPKAKELVIREQQGSVSFLQRRLRVGYARAARLIDMLEQMGVVGPFQGSKAREVMISPGGGSGEEDE
jgi:S-DNA-T family DNA segregation ATPase FtsK/SpoIIIE